MELRGSVEETLPARSTILTLAQLGSLEARDTAEARDSRAARRAAVPREPARWRFATTEALAEWRLTQIEP